MIKKIVVIGPESTGKSTLCSLLADHFKTVWVEEYARNYLLANGTEYTFGDLLDVAKGQLVLEDIATKAFTTHANENQQQQGLQSPVTSAKPLFIDTDMLVLKVWCEFVFDECHHWILNQIVDRKYDLYLLCDVDMPWVKDQLREYPDLRTREVLYHHYKDILVNQQVAWVNISGSYEERLQKAISAVQRIL